MLFGLELFLLFTALITEATSSGVVRGMRVSRAVNSAAWEEMQRCCWLSSGGEEFAQHVPEANLRRCELFRSL